MIKKFTEYHESPLEQEIERLRKQLFRERRTILDLMPKPVRDVLDTYTHCKNPDEVYLWERDIATKLLEFALPKPATEFGHLLDDSLRAACPVCGGGKSTWFADAGFAFPIGLTRHLEGSYGAHRCGVLVAIGDL